MTTHGVLNNTFRYLFFLLGGAVVLVLASVASLAILSQDPPGNYGPISATYKDGTLRVPSRTN